MPPVGHVWIGFRWQVLVVKGGAQVTHSNVDVLLFVSGFKVRLPPKVLVVQRVVPVEEYQVIGQLPHIFKFCRVNVGMRWRNLVVMIVKAEDDWNYRTLKHTEKPTK